MLIVNQTLHTHPNTLMKKLLHLSLPVHLCMWIMDRIMKPASICQAPLPTHSAPAPDRAARRAPICTYDCTHTSKSIIKFADDTVVVGLDSGGDESAHLDEIQSQTLLRSANNLSLNTMKELARTPGSEGPIIINHHGTISRESTLAPELPSEKAQQHFLQVFMRNDMWGGGGSSACKHTDSFLTTPTSGCLHEEGTRPGHRS